MKKHLARAAAAAVALGVASLAQALPLYFDFTGTVTGHTLPPTEGGVMGNAVSGGFNFDTDRLFPSSVPLGEGTQYTFVDWQPANLTEPLAYLNFGGRSLAWPSYESNYSLINFLEACPISGCAPNTSENFNLQAHSQDVWSEDFTGTRHSSFLMFISAGQTRLPDFPFFESFNYFEPEDAVPTSIATLPLHDLLGIYSETVSSCVSGVCTTIDDRQFNFSVDSVSRGVGSRSVPEPGAFGLLGAALAGMWLLRRRPQPPLFQR